MWRRKTHPDLTKDLAAVADRLRAVEQRLEDVRSETRRHGLDIEDTQERLRRAVGRFSQRLRDEKKQENGPEPHEDSEMSIDEQIRRGIIT